MNDLFRLRLLGPIQLTKGDKLAVSLKSRKVLALLCYLSQHDIPLTRTHLAGLFWRDKAHARALANLSWALNNISQSISGCLLTDRYTVQFCPQETVWVDTAVFHRLHTADTYVAYEEAIQLYQAPFMADFYIEGCQEFDLWLLSEREQWQYKIISVLQKTIAYHYDEKHIEASMQFARHLLTLAPWHEKTHQQLIYLLALSERRSEALAQYETCCRLLHQELDVQPSKTTQILYRSIKNERDEWQTFSFFDKPLLTSDKHGSREKAHHIATSTTASPQQAQSATTPFIGRKKELNQILASLKNPDCHLLTLVGCGGMGKTRLALQMIQLYQTAQAHPVYFVPLAPVRHANQIPTAIANALNVSFYTHEPVLIQLAYYLQDKQALLILDNFDHLLAGLPLFSELKALTPHIKWLITSRERLNLHDEWVFEIQGMSYLQPTPHQSWDTGKIPLENYEASQLFLQTAQRIAPAYQPTLAEREQIMHICRLVGGMPLGIELAAVWVCTLSCHDIAQEIASNLDFLTTTIADIPPRHRSLRAVFEQSWQQLTSEEQLAFSQIALFRGAFQRQTMQFVTGLSPHILKNLTDKSLLRKTADSWYQLVEGLRPYAEMKLQKKEALYKIAQQRFIQFYGAFLKEIEPRLYGYQESETLHLLGRMIENIRQAWDWALHFREIDILNGYVDCLYRFYIVRRWYQEGQAAFAQAIDIISQERLHTLSPDNRRIYVKLMIRQAHFSTDLAQYHKANALLEQSIQLAKQLQDNRLLAEAFYIWGQAQQHLGDKDTAQAHFQQSQALYKESDDLHGQAKAMNALGYLLNNWFGNIHEAAELHQKSLLIFRQIGNQRGIATTLYAQGVIAYNRCQYEKAIRLYQNCLTIFQEIDDPGKVGKTMITLALIAEVHGRYKEAYTTYETTHHIFKQIGHQNMVIYVLNAMGRVAYLMGQYQKTQQFSEENIVHCREIGNQYELGKSLKLLGTVMYAQGHTSHALKLHQESLYIGQKIGNYWLEGAALDALGYCYLQQNKFQKAARYFEKSMALFKASGNQQGVLTSLNHLGQTAVAQGQHSQAQSLFEQVLQQATSLQTIPKIMDALAGLANCLSVQGSKIEKAWQLICFVCQHPACAYETAVYAQRIKTDITAQLSPPYPTTTEPDLQHIVQSYWQIKQTAEE